MNTAGRTAHAVKKDERVDGGGGSDGESAVGWLSLLAVNHHVVSHDKVVSLEVWLQYSTSVGIRAKSRRELPLSILAAL